MTVEAEIIELNVQRPDADRLRLEAKLIDADPDTCRLVVGWPAGGEERNFDGSDFYECLRAFRRVIEPEGFLVLCQGARPNVCPSGMSRAAGALLSYVLNRGQPALTGDLVRTFDPVDDIVMVGTVAEQDEWMAQHWRELAQRTSSE